MRKPLGKGLGNLLTAEPKDKQAAGIVEIPTEKIMTNPENPRKNFQKLAIDQLAATIKTYGLLQPILVMKQASGYRVVSGERRLRACRQLGLKSIPCIVKKYEKKIVLEVALIENIQREQLDPIEEANVYKSLINLNGINQEELAAKVGKNRATIANRMRLLQLPEALQAAIADRRISEGQARPLLGISSEAVQIKLLREIENNNFTARQVEDLVKRQKGKPKSKAKKTAPSEVRNVENLLQEKLQIRARLLHDEKKGNGRLILEYFSLEDLDRILQSFGINSKEFKD